MFLDMYQMACGLIPGFARLKIEVMMGEMGKMGKMG